MTTDPWGKPAPSDPWAKPVDTQSPPAPDAWGLPAVKPADNWGPVVPPTPPAPVVNDDWAKDAWNTPKQTALVGDWGSMKDDPDAIQTDGGWGHAAGFQEPKQAQTFPVPMYHAESDAYFLAETQDELDGALNDGCDEIALDTWHHRKAASEKARYDERDAKWVTDGLTGAEERARIANSFQRTQGQEWVVSQDGELERTHEVFAKNEKGNEVGFYLAYSQIGGLLHAVLSGPYKTKGDALLKADHAYTLMTEDNNFKLAFDNKFQRAGMYVAEIELKARRHGAYGVLA